MIFLSDEVKKVLNETYEQRLERPVTALRLPCARYHRYREPSYVQITRTGDQKVSCPQCGREHYLTWQPVSGHRFR